MKEYIDRDTLLTQINKNRVENSNERCAQILEAILYAPAADVAEVRHGYNKTSMHPVDEFWCSECGFCCADYTETKYDEDGDYTYSCECQFSYCPRCGAKMDEKGED